MAAPVTERITLTGGNGEAVEFNIRKLLAPEAYNLLEMVRPCLVSLAGVEDRSESGLGMAAAAVSLVPPATLLEMRNMMFRQVLFKSTAVPEWATLLGQEGTAFKDLEAFHIYEVTIRSLVVNLKGSWGAALSFMGNIGVDLNSLVQETLRGSSPIPSPPGS